MTRPGARRTVAALAAVLAALLPAAWAAPAHAQVVTGTVSSLDYERPVAGAAVLLLDADLAPVDSTATDRAGSYRLAAAPAGEYVLLVRLEGHLTVTERVTLRDGGTERLDIEMPLVSHAAAAAMAGTIDREAALQLPLEELCAEPLRPWEAGVLLGVARERDGLDPVPAALASVEPLDDPAGPAAVRSRTAAESGVYWFCNLPAGRARLVVRAPGFRADTSVATIRPGTISWYDALLRRR